MLKQTIQIAMRNVITHTYVGTVEAEVTFQVRNGKLERTGFRVTKVNGHDGVEPGELLEKFGFDARSTDDWRLFEDVCTEMAKSRIMIYDLPLVK